MLNRFFSWLWVNHPRTQAPDAMLTFAGMALVTCVIKVLLSDVTITVATHTIALGKVDATVIAAMLSPTLAAYYGRKKDSPLVPEEKENAK